MSNFDDLLRKSMENGQQPVQDELPQTESFDNLLKRKQIESQVVPQKIPSKPVPPTTRTGLFDTFLKEQLVKNGNVESTPVPIVAASQPKMVQTIPNTPPQFSFSKEPLEFKDRPITNETLNETYGNQGLELGNEKIVLGDLDDDGYKIIHANMRHRQEKSHGQDGFGISPDRKTFCVADGMGGAPHSGDIARFLSHELTKDNNSWEQAFEDGGLESLIEKFIEDVRAKDPAIKADKFNGHTTMSLCRINDDGSVNILQLGDSPVYVKTKDGNLISYGDDNINDADTGIALGVTDGSRQTTFDLKQNIHTVQNVDSITCATDWFSDNYQSRTKEYNEAWLDKYELKYPTLKLTPPSVLGTASGFINEYHIRKTMLTQGTLESFDPMKFKDVKNEAEIKSEMTSKYITKPDDITIAMFNVPKILENK
ncbi:MAG: protein phosphatase 2C domain-containing protein [Patescibacteria group bacterium]